MRRQGLSLRDGADLEHRHSAFCESESLHTPCSQCSARGFEPHGAIGLVGTCPAWEGVTVPPWKNRTARQGGPQGNECLGRQQLLELVQCGRERQRLPRRTARRGGPQGNDKLRKSQRCSRRGARVAAGSKTFVPDKVGPSWPMNGTPKISAFSNR